MRDGRQATAAFSYQSHRRRGRFRETVPQVGVSFVYRGDVMIHHPAAAYEPSMNVLVARSQAARIALVVSTVMVAVPQLAQLYVSRPLAMGAVTVSLGVKIVTVVLFLQWLHRLVTIARQLGSPSLAFSPGAAVWSFFIPILNLFRPYQVLRDAQATLSPDTVPEPPLRPDTEGVVGYRQMAVGAGPENPRPAERASRAGGGGSTCCTRSTTIRRAARRPCASFRRGPPCAASLRASLPCRWSRDSPRVRKSASAASKACLRRTSRQLTSFSADRVSPKESLISRARRWHPFLRP